MSEKELHIGQEQQADISQFVDPFPGLRPFGIEESHLFFGREGQSDEVLMKLAENKFVGILGASGSGKSSLMYCGLIPTLYGGFMTQAGSNWRIVVTRPGGGPIDNLAEALLSKDQIYNELDDEEQLIRKTITSTVLRSSSLGLIEAVKQLKSSDQENVLILVDQFEELFRYKKLETLSSDLDESSAFVNLLLEAVHQYDAPIYVALTMRSDFIGDCAAFPDLTQMINDSHYLIPQMTRDQKRLAIEGPVAVGGGKIAPRLTQQLLNDVGDNPDQLPILQHALMRTWQFWKEYRREGEPMDLKHYNAIGTLREALSQHANEAFDSLSKREQQICESMFKALTERGTETSGIRRPTKLATIAAISGVNEEEVTRVVDKFREPGRTLLMPPHGVKIDSETVVDISHESLMRIWTRLKSWLDEESRSAEMYLKLAESAERFQLGRAGLWKMPDLQLALNWQEENKPTLVWGQRYDPAFERTLVFLETSKKAYETEQRNKELLQKRALQRSRIVAIVLAFAMLVSIFFVVLSQIKADEADKKTIEAEINLRQAEENAAKAKEEEQKAVEAAAKARIEERKANEARADAEKALQQAEIEKQRADVQRQRALLAQAEAQANQKKAEEAAEQARIAQAEAVESAEQARLAEAAALKLRYQAIANSMAIKSKGIDDDVEQKALIARQAWKFDKEYGVKEYNADVYSGVYYAYRDLLFTDSTDIFNQYKGHITGNAVRSVRFAADGKSMFSAGSDGKLLSWDMTNDRKKSKVLIDNNFVNRVVDLSPEERWLAVGSDDDRILLYDLKNSGQEPKELTGHSGTVFDLVFLKGDEGFISSSGDKVIRKNDYKTSTEIARVASRVKALALSPDGRFLAGGSESGSVYLWDLENNYEEKSLYIKGGSAVHAISFNRDGKILAIGDDEGDVILWDLQESKQIRRLTGHDAKVTDLEFSKDNTLLASTSFDGTARIWVMEFLNDLPIVLDDHGTGRGSKKWVWSAAFSPDGQTLMTGAGDGVIRYWPTHPDEMALEICGNPKIEHNLSVNSWNAYVGEDIDYKETCEGKPKREDNQ
ncbi:High-affnity carbon uptake protein Hat/HatR [Reichenbachiella carrageenanivorans]|uniref:High-affnity carbon uptake protein Hat/HatR n=1 Tax=Reichenbachiella carrageenanivorans TaxID=2979869 RepID=A0ABY6D124_9BACT|nr:High-affnity carbon uptake protein Hat/HatR [Reichenbachiella carrageenanivorans]UXX79320.1 High-affnity carbon uptake protein Hat/HatR [Reichenbachiella carrageenanivorans]